MNFHLEGWPVQALVRSMSLPTSQHAPKQAQRAHWLAVEHAHSVARLAHYVPRQQRQRQKKLSKRVAPSHLAKRCYVAKAACCFWARAACYLWGRVACFRAAWAALPCLREAVLHPVVLLHRLQTRPMTAQTQHYALGDLKKLSEVHRLALVPEDL